MPANMWPMITGYDKLSVKIFSDRKTLLSLLILICGFFPSSSCDQANNAATAGVLTGPVMLGNRGNSTAKHIEEDYIKKQLVDCGNIPTARTVNDVAKVK